MAQMKQSRLTDQEVLALRGLRLPAGALRSLKKSGIYCEPAVSIEHQQLARQYVIRAVESGGAVAAIGAYCSFVDDDGAPLTGLHRVDTVGVNGLHAVVVASGLVRVQMLRIGRTYEILLTHHSLASVEDKRRPRLVSTILFHGRRGMLEMELWGKDKQFRGAMVPIFYSRSGEQAVVPERFRDALVRVTAGVCCVGCRHVHLVELPTGEKIAKEKPAEELAK